MSIYADENIDYSLTNAQFNLFGKTLGILLIWKGLFYL